MFMVSQFTESGVDLLHDVLQQHRQALLYGDLHYSQVVVIAELDHRQPVVLLHVLHPLVGLTCNHNTGTVSNCHLSRMITTQYKQPPVIMFDINNDIKFVFSGHTTMKKTIVERL